MGQLFSVVTTENVVSPLDSSLNRSDDSVFEHELARGDSEPEMNEEPEPAEVPIFEEVFVEPTPPLVEMLGSRRAMGPRTRTVRRRMPTMAAMYPFTRPRRPVMHEPPAQSLTALRVLQMTDKFREIRRLREKTSYVNIWHWHTHLKLYLAERDLCFQMDEMSKDTLEYESDAIHEETLRQAWTRPKCLVCKRKNRELMCMCLHCKAIVTCDDCTRSHFQSILITRGVFCPSCDTLWGSKPATKPLRFGDGWVEISNTKLIMLSGV